jgi:glycosyltransferase involved in cell wall biosynthesis
MASEVPVIATRAGGLPEVIEDGVNGYLLSVGDVEVMAERAIEILSNDDVGRKMGAAGRAIAIEKFAEEKIVPRYREMYERVLDLEPSPTGRGWPKAG